MKIISIKFLNLNSLKGEHEIRFDAPPFTGSGIFAITGPTGAGKTTLLDAITVALYGKVHRHQKDVFEIMTRHTAESYAEVEFEVGYKIYRSRWSIRRSRGKADGQLQTQRMELAEALTGKIIIEHPLQEVREEIVRTCGLDYNQFLRSVILSQGDFTRFLKADENERSELLEKITDTGIYSAISVAAYEKAREERQLLDELKSRLNHVVLLSAAERGMYSEELAGLAAGEVLLRQEGEQCRQQLAWLQQLERLRERKAALVTALAQAEQEYLQQEPGFARLEQHKKASVHRPALDALQGIAVQEQQIRSGLAQLAGEIPAAQEQESASALQLKELLELADREEQLLAEAIPVFEEVVKKDLLAAQALEQRELLQKAKETAVLHLQQAAAAQDTLLAEVIALQERISRTAQWLQENSGDAALEKDSLVLQQLSARLAELDLQSETWGQAQQEYRLKHEAALVLGRKAAEQRGLTGRQLEETAALLKAAGAELEKAGDGKTAEQLEALLRELPVIIQTSGQQLKLSAGYTRLIQEKKEHETALQHHRSLSAGMTLELTDLQQHAVQAQQLLQDLQDIYALEVRVQQYETARPELRPGQPCPLCGSLTHPFIEGNYVSGADSAAARRNEQQEKLNSLRAAIDERLLRRNTSENTSAAAEKSLAALETAMTALLSEFELNNRKLPAPLDLQRPDVIAAVIAKKEAAHAAAAHQLQQMKAIQQQISQAEAAMVRQRELLAGYTHQEEQAKLNTDFAAQQLADGEKAVIRLRAETAELTVRAEALLEPSGIRFETAAASRIVNELQARARQYQARQAELANLQLSGYEKDTELKNTLRLITERSSVLETAGLQFLEAQQVLQRLQEERAELFGSKDPVQERLQLTQRTKNYRRQSMEQQQLLQEKQEKLKILEDRRANLNTRLAETRQQYRSHQEELLEKVQAGGIASLEALAELFMPEEEAAALERLQQEALQRMASGRSLLEATAAEQEKETGRALTAEPAEVIQPLLDAQEQALSALQEQKGRLGKILADDDALKIRHSAVAAEIEKQQQQADRFQQLSAMIGSADGKKFSRFAQGLTLARLTGLANRHLSRLSDRYTILKSPGKDLELQIIDGYQADVVRPMSTLSGGESFLVSLALALGLSDLASRKVQINSLFIDEGFGTLDADTLDVAISALENLQAGGKSIGIISHVEALKERIITQIQLTRLPGGSSRISITG